MSEPLPAADAHLVWTKGGTASLLTIAQDNVTLRSSIPSPPGARLDATLASDPSVAMKIKIHGSKLQPDGSFTLKGRVLEATRALRDRLTSLVPPTPP
ncbi:MAG: hypothetical protein JWO86_7911 [Myxococcaceae bacterium]|nr:hypothetical protein [Myxococcaceae bacterium]